MRPACRIHIKMLLETKRLFWKIGAGHVVSGTGVFSICKDKISDCLFNGLELQPRG